MTREMLWRPVQMIHPTANVVKLAKDGAVKVEEKLTRSSMIGDAEIHI